MPAMISTTGATGSDVCGCTKHVAEQVHVIYTRYAYLIGRSGELSGSLTRARLTPLLAGLLLAAGPVSASDATVAKAQLPVARLLLSEARAVVAITHPVITQVDPHEGPFRTQDFTVSGIAAACWKGDVKPGARVSYTVTAEGRPARLSQDHIAFLRSGAGGRWIAVDGPVFHDSPEMRRGLSRLLHGCSK